MQKTNKPLDREYSTGIPEQLHDFKLIKVEPRGKAAIEKDWPNTQNYQYNDPKLLRYLNAGGNYGVIAGDVIIIDTDTHELQNLIQRLIGCKTFSVLTPGHETKQFYVHVKWTSKNSWKTIPLYADPKNPNSNLGHVKIGNSYGIGPGSTHPNGNKYTVADYVPILEISEDQFKSILKGLAPYIANRAYDNEKKLVSKKQVSGKFDITKIIPNLKEMKRHGNELQGPHPVHGSTSGTNFTVNPRKGVWHCFRCQSGGGPLQLLAVTEGLIQCNEAVPGALHGELFRQVLRRAREKKLIPQAKMKVKN